MINKNLQYVLDNINPDLDESAWQKFCEWVESFHDLDTDNLTQYDNFLGFNKNGKAFPLKYFDTIRDLWCKWKKATEVDAISNSKRTL